jgi:hypothetical protein
MLHIYYNYLASLDIFHNYSTTLDIIKAIPNTLVTDRQFCSRYSCNKQLHTLLILIFIADWCINTNCEAILMHARRLERLFMAYRLFVAKFQGTQITNLTNVGTESLVLSLS